MGFFSRLFSKKEKNNLPSELSEDFLIEVDGVERMYQMEFDFFGDIASSTLDVSESFPMETAIMLGNQLIDWYNVNRHNVETRIIEQLLPMKNESWLEEDELPWNATDFLNSIHLVSFLVREERFTIWYADNDLFYGHLVEVRVTSNFEVEEICLSGVE